MSQPSKSLDNVYTLSKLFTCEEIKLSAWNKSGSHEVLVLFIKNESFIYYYFTQETPIIKQIPWFNDPLQAPVSIDLSPSGAFLLILSKSCHLHVLPVLSLLDSTFESDILLDTNDLTVYTYPFSSKVSKIKSKPKCSNSSLSILTSLSVHSSSFNNSNEKQRSSSCSSSDSLSSENVMKLKEISGSKCEVHPTAVCWWQTLEASQDVGIIGTKSGEILFVDLTTGLKLGETKVKEGIKSLSVCQDDKADYMFLLITTENNTQYRLMLEQRSLNYIWSGKQNANGSGDECSDGTNVLNGNGSTLPSARARLQGLKQMSAEKLASWKHKIAETRSKIGAKQGLAEENSVKSSGPLPENLGFVVGDTLISPQVYSKGNVLAGYYTQSQLLTVHSMNLDIAPLFIHKMPVDVEEVLICDRVIFIISNGRTILRAISSKLTETWFDQSHDFNPESVLGTWNFDEISKTNVNDTPTTNEKSPVPKPDLIPEDFPDKHAERIINIYRSQGKIEEYNIAKIYNLEKTKEELPEVPVIENCIVVTNKSVYSVELKPNVLKMALDLILETHKLEEAERVCTIFGINLQQLLELAGDVKLAALEFSTAIALYKLSKCGLLKSIVKLACGNHCSQVLNYSTILMANSLSDMSLTERIHLSNLILMAYTQQILKNENNRHLMEKFLEFLQQNCYFDQVLAVSVTGQSLLFHCLHKLITYRGLILDGYNVLIQLMERFINSKVLQWSLNKNEFWKCATGVDLIEAMVVKPLSFPTYAEYVSKYLNDLDMEHINRLLKVLDPTAPAVRPIARIFRKDDSFDNDDTQTVFSFDKMIELFVLALLVKLHKTREADEKYNREFILPLPDVLETESTELSFYENESFASGENMGEEIWPIRKEIQGDNEKFRKRTDGILSCGYGHTALIRNGCVYTWGQTAKGCLGRGATMSRYLTPSPITWFGSFKLEVSVVSCGKYHSAALTNNGVYTWGSSKFGQLGLGDIYESPHPRLVKGLASENVISIACGQYHTLALTNQGSVFAWGWGVHGQLGLGCIDNQRVPKYIHTLKEHFIVDVAAGHGHSLVLSDKGHVSAFGSSVFGQLGTGTNTKSSVPVFVKGITGRVVLIATGYFHNLALTDTNTLYTWGSSPQCLRFQAQARKKSRLLQNQNSSNSSSSDSVKPCNEEGREQTSEKNGHLDKIESEMHLSATVVDTTNVTGNITQISCGCHHSALVTSSGGLYTWGISIDGQLGNGSHKEVSIPTQINAESFKVDFVSCGCEFTTAEEKLSGKIYSWGNNAVGQLAVPIKESATKSLDGKLVVLKSFKRIVRFLDRGAGSNSVDTPREIPEIPSPTFTYHTLSKHTSSSPGSLSDIDPEYSHRSLHFVIEKFTNHINLPFIFKKSLEYRNFQAASKISLLQNKCKQSIVYQLKALQDLQKYRFKSASYSEKQESKEENSETQEIHLFTVEGGQEDMCDGSKTLNGGKLVGDFGDQAKEKRSESSGVEEEEEKTKSLKVEYMDHAKHILETYLNLNSSQVYEDFDNCSILETAVQFWTAEKLPMSSLESFMYEKLENIYYDLGYFLFCTQQRDYQASILEHFSTTFLLAVTKKILSRVEKNESCVEYLETMTKILTNDDNSRKMALTKKKRAAKRKKPKSEMYLEEIRDNLQQQGVNENFIKISYGDIVGENVYFFSCGHHHSAKSLEEDCKVFQELTDETVASKLISFYGSLEEESKGDFACPSCVRNYLRQ